MHKSVRQTLPVVVLLASIVVLYGALHLALGTQPFAHSIYDSYTLQALAWREGRLSLGQAYPHLELAMFNGEWYVSFPPVPSLVQLPLTFLFGRNTPDGLLVKVYVTLSCLLLYFYFRRVRKLQPWHACLWSLFLIFASDILSISLDGGVWYQAQTLNLLLLTAAFVAMARKKPTLSCALYALAVGCRPFSVLFGPVLLTMYLQSRPPRRPLWPGLAVGLGIAACYAAYNLARFGNPFEFGHNYLPEFVNSEHGQFSLSYLGKNVRTFLRGLPFAREGGALVLKMFGFSMFLCNPTTWLTPVWVACAALRRRVRAGAVISLALMGAHLFCLLLHKSFGGLQFGARYTLDLIPYAFACLHFLPRRAPRTWENLVFFAFVAFNAVGAHLLYR